VPTATLRPPNLECAEGAELYSATEALLKGVLESEIPIALVAGPRRPPLAGLGETLADERIARLFSRHGCTVLTTPDGARAVQLALHEARSRRSALAAVPNGDLDASIAALERLAGERLVGEAGVVVLLEDDEQAAPSACPRRAAERLGLACIEPADLDGLRRAVEQALRLSLVARRAVAVVSHVWIGRSIETLEARPNRVVDTVDAALAMRRRRGPRVAEGLDLLRMARRLELNRHEATPNPGELAPIGFIAVGPAQTAIRHLLNELRLTGRVPVLHLGLVHPIDEPALERLIDRTEQVVLLAPRGSSIGPFVAEAAERLRTRAPRPCRLWVGTVPPEEGQAPQRLEHDDALRPSALARRLLHVLHTLRPAMRLASRLHSADPPSITLPPRSGPTPQARLEAAVRQALVDLGRWLPGATGREGTPLASGLVIDGVPGAASARRQVLVELWTNRRFARDGAATVRQAARDPRPRLILVVDHGGDDEPDPERLARAAAPGGRNERISIESCGVSDRAELRERLREAALRDGASMLLIRDDVRDDGSLSAEQAAVIDRLGFQPAQRLVWPAELPCDLRPSLPRSLAEAGGAKAWVPFAHHLRTDRIAGRRGGALRFRLRPLLERTEVVRSRPPTPLLRLETSGRLAPPRPLHADRGLWRLHCAGLRGPGAGAAVEALCEAGRTMGFHVRCMSHPAPIGSARRAWAQVLFTRPRSGEEAPALTVQIPHGEADVLLGTDALETMRALGVDGALRIASPERTHTVANVALLEDQIDAGVSEIAEPLTKALAAACVAERSLIDDLAGPCRAWFLTDRPLDVVLLGAAYQRGLVPVSLEAMELGLRRAEQRGVARCLDAFALGRRLAVEERPAMRRVDEPRERIGREIRRHDLELRHARVAGKTRRAYRRLAESTLAATEPLDRTPTGQVARQDMVVALGRCMSWGGLAHASRFARLVLGLMDAERIANGDAVDIDFGLTRQAILPLADAMLIRDLAYVAMMATSLEHRRRVRQRLGVRLARGDEVERRYLNRLDVAGFGWRIRLDFRTSDWPARLTSVVGRWVPLRWRGTPADRAVLDLVAGLVERATMEVRRDGHAGIERWRGTLDRLNDIAETTRLRGIPATELQSRLDAETTNRRPREKTTERIAPLQ